tara:strand:- start:353 stop:469 length:117 start_codon:yes stop_codon:yes gene_type:complete
LGKGNLHTVTTQPSRRREGEGETTQEPLTKILEGENNV